jgi:hypothetical protein
MGCFRIIVTLVLLLIGAGSVALLVRIKGTSDGPGALFIYMTAFFGLAGGLSLAFGGRSRR